MVEYPSESAPALSGEDGGELPPPLLERHCFRGLPWGCEPGTLKEGPTPLSVRLVHAISSGAPPTSCSVESDLLGNLCSAGWSSWSVQDLG